MKKIERLKQAVEIVKKGEPQELKDKVVYFNAKKTLEQSKALFVVDMPTFLEKAAKTLSEKTGETWKSAKLYSFYAIDTTRDPMFFSTYESFYVYGLTKLSESEIKTLKQTNLNGSRSLNPHSTKLLNHIKSGEIIPINIHTDNEKHKKNLLSNHHFLTPVLKETIDKTWEMTGKISQYNYYYHWVSLPKEHISVFSLLDNEFKQVTEVLEDVVFEEVSANIKKESEQKQLKLKEQVEKKEKLKEQKREQIKTYLKQIEDTKEKIVKLEAELQN